MEEYNQESDPSKTPSIGSSKASITCSLNNHPIRPRSSSFPLPCPQLQHDRVPFQLIPSSYQQPHHGFIPYRQFPIPYRQFPPPRPYPYQQQQQDRKHYPPAPARFYPQPSWPPPYNYPFHPLPAQQPQRKHQYGNNIGRDSTTPLPTHSLSPHSTKMSDLVEFTHCLELSEMWKDKRETTPYFDLFTKKYINGERGWLIDLLKHSDTSLLDYHDLFVRFAPYGSMYVDVVHLFYHAFDMDDKSIRNAKMKQRKLDAQQPKGSVSFAQHYFLERSPVDAISLCSLPCRPAESAVKASSEKENGQPDSSSSSSSAVTFPSTPTPRKRREREVDDPTTTVLKVSTIVKKQEATTPPKKQRRMNVGDLLDIMQLAKGNVAVADDDENVSANCIQNV
jgi:hypothetical protein